MYEDLVELIRHFHVAFPRDGQGVSRATLDRAEAELGWPFPESYRWWLLNFGGGQIRGDIVYGLDEGGVGKPDIVELAKMNARDGFYDPERIVFCMGNGENFYFDRSSQDNSEYRIILHDIGTGEEIPYADHFADFLRLRIRELH